MKMLMAQDQQQWSNAAEDTIEVVDSDPSWPDQFVAESFAIEKVLHPFKPRIEHFGSTAIPNLPAKPIIDILVIIADVSVRPRLVEPLSSLAYIYWAENPHKDRMFFVKGMPPFGSRRSHHVHVRTPKDLSELVFRDWLRRHPADVDRYALLKRRLAKRFKTDRETYTAAKSEFIEQMLKRANTYKHRAANRAGI